MSLTPEQLAQRAKGIGGSDVAALVGTSPWSTPRDVWLEKAGLTERAESEAMRWGTLLEPVIIRRYAEEHPEACVMRNATTIHHLDYDWMLATPDAIAVSNGGEVVWGVEAKTANAFAGKNWAEGVPDYYQAQVQFYMGVLDYDRWDVAVLIGGSDYREFTIERDDEMIDVLFKAAEAFHNDHMLAGECPAPSTPAEWSKTPVRDETILWANAEQEETALAYFDHVDTLRTEQAIVNDYKGYLQAIIGEHAGLEGPGFKITWRASGKSRRFVAKRKEQ